MVLENRHVMTLFFVVVVLCGVFFGLGYIVGKNTVATASAQAPPEAAAKEQGKKSPLEAAEKKTEPQAADVTKTLEDKGAAPVLETPASAAPASAAAAAATRTAAPPEPKPPAAQPSAAPTAAVIQVGALKTRGDADSMASALTGKGFAPIVDQQADGLFHVLVPVPSTAQAEEVKARIEKAGFKSPFIKKK